MRRVFLDASALVPIVVKNDQWRPAVNRVLATLHSAEFVTTNWTLYEGLALAQRAGKPVALGLLQFATEDTDVVGVDAAVEEEALRRFVAWRDSTASVVDHANTLVAAASKCHAVISFDRDFVVLAQAAGMELMG